MVREEGWALFTIYKGSEQNGLHSAFQIFPTRSRVIGLENMDLL